LHSIIGRRQRTALAEFVALANDAGCNAGSWLDSRTIEKPASKRFGFPSE
jgi:hypothetical protein